MGWQSWFLNSTELIFLGLGAYFDIKSRELPIPYLTGFCICGILLNIIWNYQKIEMVLGGILVGCLFLVFGKLSREAIGYGDGLSFLILGIFVGWESLLGILFLAFFLSGIYGGWRMIWHREKFSDEIPFLPFLLLAKLGELFI